MKLEGKSVLVTGCTGFLGSHLTKSLVKHKKIRVRGLIKDRSVDFRKIGELPIEKVFSTKYKGEVTEKYAEKIRERL